MLTRTQPAPGAPPAIAQQGPLSSLGYHALLLGVALATAAGVAAGEPILALAPSVGAAAAYAMAKAPLRLSAAALLLLLLAVEDHSETLGQFRTPLAHLGDLFHERLDQKLRVPGLAVTGMEVALVFLLGVWAHRRATMSRVDLEGHVPWASVLRPFLLVYVGGVLASEAIGLARGLPLVPWKLRNLLHPVALGLLFLAAHRGPRDYRLLGRVVVFAACARAIQAVVVQRIGIAETGGKFATATSHGDSVLFAAATFLLLATFVEQPDRRRALRLLLLLPILLVGVLENGRRIAWVMLAFAPAFAFLVSPMRPWKRSLLRVLLVVIPLASLYVGVGWNRGGPVFGPVQTLRGLVDTKANRSSYWREVEIWNIAVSMRRSPLLGLGLGGEYTEHMMNDDISSIYKEYKEWPHNTVLGLLLLMGLFGFTAVWLLPALTMFLSVRSYRIAATPDLRIAALGCMGAVTACGVLAYGDTGAHYTQYKVFFGLAMAVSARLAVATGAWPSRGGALHGAGLPRAAGEGAR